MKRITGGRLEVNSAYEALQFGRAATYGKKDEVPNLSVSHAKGLAATQDEVLFFERSLEHKSDPVLDKNEASAAIKGLEAIVASGKVYRSIKPEIARYFLDVYRSQAEDMPSSYDLEEGPLSADTLRMRVIANYPPESVRPRLTLVPPAEELEAVETRFNRAGTPFVQTA